MDKGREMKFIDKGKFEGVLILNQSFYPLPNTLYKLHRNLDYLFKNAKATFFFKALLLSPEIDEKFKI